MKSFLIFSTKTLHHPLFQSHTTATPLNLLKPQSLCHRSTKHGSHRRHVGRQPGSADGLVDQPSSTWLSRVSRPSLASFLPVWPGLLLTKPAGTDPVIIASPSIL